MSSMSNRLCVAVYEELDRLARPSAIKRIVYRTVRAIAEYDETGGEPVIAILRAALDHLQQDINRGAYTILLPPDDPRGKRAREWAENEQRRA
jgi:hypothetical protein